MSNLPRFALLTTNSSFFPSLLKGELERPGLYNWIRAFQTSDIELADMLKLWKQFEKNPEKLNKFDIIHVNLAGGDYGLASLIAPSLDDSTKLVVNTDYAVMNLEPTFKQAPIEMMATDIASADMAFGVEPFNVKLMNWLMKVTKQEKKAYLLPHPVDCDRLTKPPEQGGSFLDFDERLDWLAFHWHRYDQALSVPRTVMGNLPMTEYGGGVSRVLFGWRPDALRIKDAKNLMEVVIPMQAYVNYLIILSHCLWGFEYRFHRAASRFHMECATLGIPVVSSKNSFMGTMLWPELTFEMGEFEQMNAALCEIISDDGLRRKYARQGMERVKQFSLINSRNRYLELLYGDDKD